MADWSGKTTREINKGFQRCILISAEEAIICGIYDVRLENGVLNYRKTRIYIEISRYSIGTSFLLHGRNTAL